MANDETLAALDRVAAHLQWALCTYVEGDDTRATELTGEELRDVARAIIPIIRDEDRAQIVAWLRNLHWTHRDAEPAKRIADAIEAGAHVKENGAPLK